MNININTISSISIIKRKDKINASQSINFISLPPLSLYIHFPWCEKKCLYCDFNSHDNTSIDEINYLTALENDLIACLPLIWGRTIYSVFIGGGTPSLMSVSAIQKIMQIVYTLLPMHSCQEITIEANPNSSDSNKFQGFADAGINRLSLGIQSFNDLHLSKLGRTHDSYQGKKAIENAQKYFANMNLDLMFALPHQNIEHCKKDIETAISFGVNHLSFYHLTLEPNTYFAKYPPLIPNEDSAYEMHDLVINMLAEYGYKRYEISAYSKNNTPSMHNLNYWHFGDYVGIGAGAHGKISYADKIIRYVKHKHPKTYIQNALNLSDAQNSQHIIEQRKLSISEIPFEYMLGALRLIHGTKIKNFIQNTSLGYHHIDKNIQLAKQKGLLEDSHEYIKATKLGIDFLNDLQILFL